MEHWGAFYNAWSAFIAAARFAAAASKAASTSTSVVEGLYKDAMAQVSDYPDQAGRGVKGSAFENLGYSLDMPGLYGCLWMLEEILKVTIFR